MAADVWRWCPVHQKWLPDVNSRITKAGLAKACYSRPQSSLEGFMSGRPDCLQLCAGPRAAGGAAAASRWRDNRSRLDPFPPHNPPPPPPTDRSPLKEVNSQSAYMNYTTETLPTAKSLCDGLTLGRGDNAATPGNALTSLDTPFPTRPPDARPSKWLFETPVQSRIPADYGHYDSMAGIGNYGQMEGNGTSYQPPFDSIKMLDHRRSSISEIQYSRVPSPMDDAPEGPDWVTVFGSRPAACAHGEQFFRFGPVELSVVMREFEKCGQIVDKIVGPNGSNWVHLRYQNPHEAGMAIMKNGMQLNGSIIVGVRSLDSRERKELEEESNLKIANKRPLSRQRKYARPGSESGSRSGSRIEDSDTPAKSSISRFVDLVFECERDHQISAGGFVIPIKFEPGLYKELFTPQTHRCDEFVTKYCDPAASVPLYYEYPRKETDPCTYAEDCLEPMRESPGTPVAEEAAPPMEDKGPSVTPLAPLKGDDKTSSKWTDKEFATIEALQLLRAKVMNLSSPFVPGERDLVKEQRKDIFNPFLVRPLHTENYTVHSREDSEWRREDGLQSSQLPGRDEASTPWQSNEGGSRGGRVPSRRTRRHRPSCAMSESGGQRTHKSSCPEFKESAKLDQPPKYHACPILQVVRGEGPLSTNFTNRQKLQARRHKSTCIFSHGDKRGSGRRHRPFCHNSPLNCRETYQSFYQGVPTREKELPSNIISR